MGAIGTTHFLETTNTGNAVYERTGTRVKRWDLDSFWRTVVGLDGSGSFDNGDQRVLFDHYTNRWIAVGFSDVTSNIAIGISDTENPLGRWKSTSFQGCMNCELADYPTLAVDDRAVYIGTINYGPNEIYIDTTFHVIPRASLFGTIPNTDLMSSFSQVGPSALQGALSWQPIPGETSNILTTRYTGILGNVDRAQVVGIGTPAPTVVTDPSNPVLTLPTAYTLTTPPARQPDGTRLVNTLGDRLSANVVQVNGRLYGVQTIFDAASDFTKLRWFVLDAITGVEIDVGLIESDGYDYYQGSIAVNEWGEAVISYNRSGGTSQGVDGRISFYAQAFVTNTTGHLNPLGPSLLLRRSDIDNYLAFIPEDGESRWGDYAATSLDPINPRQFWAIGEFALASPYSKPDRIGQWGTYISALEIAHVSDPVPGPFSILGGATGFHWSRRLRRRIHCTRAVQ